MLSRASLERTASNILSLDYFAQAFKGIVPSLNGIGKDYPLGLDPSVRIILLKGEALLDCAYEDEFSRYLAEIDVLIKREDFPRIKHHLSGRGYRFPENITPSPDCSYINSVMCKKDVKFWPAIHLHWHPVNTSFPGYMFAPRIDLDAIWREAKQLQGYDNVLIMSPHHQLIYLSEHALKHSFERPVHLRDIHALIDRHKNDLDWDRVVSEAKRFNLSRAVYYALYFASGILGTEIPARALKALKPVKFTFLERKFMDSVLNKRQKSNSSYAVYLAMNERIPDKIKFIYRTLFPPREVMGFMLDLPPEKVNLIHYLSRIIKGIQTGGNILP